MGAAVEPPRGTKQLARSVLAHACAQGRACGIAVHRRRGARTVDLARLPDWHGLAHGHWVRAAAPLLAPFRPRRHRARAGAARGARRAVTVLRRRLGIAAGRFRNRKPGHLRSEHRAAGARHFDPFADRRRRGRGARPAAARDAGGGSASSRASARSRPLRCCCH